MIDRNRRRKDQRPYGIQKACSPHHQVTGDHSAAEQHRENKKPHEDIPFGKYPFGFGERIPGKDRGQHVDAHS